jgi:hypothetical protein
VERSENEINLTRSREGAEIKKEFHAESAENAEDVVDLNTGGMQNPLSPTPLIIEWIRSGPAISPGTQPHPLRVSAFSA